MKSYTPCNWYWAVAGSTTQVFSSAVASYVPIDDATYQQWVATGGVASRINSEEELWDVLAAQCPAGLPAGAGGTGAFHLDPATQEYLNRLRTATPAELDTWLDGNTNNVPQMREIIKRMVRIDALIIRRAAF